MMHMVAVGATAFLAWLLFDIQTVWSLPFLVPFVSVTIGFVVLQQFFNSRLELAPLQNLSYYVHREVNADLQCSATELAQRIRHNITTSTAVVSAHITQIRAVNHALNALVADCFDDALARAAAIDEYLRRRRAAAARVRAAMLSEHCPALGSMCPPRVLPADLVLAVSQPPPFLGVPFTTKECFAVAGLPNTSGLLSRAPTALLTAAADQADASALRARADAAVHAATLTRRNAAHPAANADPFAPPAWALTGAAVPRALPAAACDTEGILTTGFEAAIAADALPVALVTPGSAGGVAFERPAPSLVAAAPTNAVRGVSLVTSPAVARLRRSGLVLLGVSNTSELCMWMESQNRVYGRTANPYDLARTPGGSSGGEAALVAALASPLSMGSDVGGSIRMPCFFTGLYGHKPSGGVTSNRGQWPPSAAADVTAYSYSHSHNSGVGVGAVDFDSAGDVDAVAWPLTGETDRICQTGPIVRHPADLWPALLAIRGAPLPTSFATVALPTGPSAGCSGGRSATVATVAGGIEADPMALPRSARHVTTLPVLPAGRAVAAAAGQPRAGAMAAAGRAARGGISAKAAAMLGFADPADFPDDLAALTARAAHSKASRARAASTAARTDEDEAGAESKSNEDGVRERNAVRSAATAASTAVATPAISATEACSDTAAHTSLLVEQPWVWRTTAPATEDDGEDAIGFSSNAGSDLALAGPHGISSTELLSLLRLRAAARAAAFAPAASAAAAAETAAVAEGAALVAALRELNIGSGADAATAVAVKRVLAADAFVDDVLLTGPAAGARITDADADAPDTTAGGLISASTAPHVDTAVAVAISESESETDELLLEYRAMCSTARSSDSSVMVPVHVDRALLAAVAAMLGLPVPALAGGESTAAASKPTAFVRATEPVPAGAELSAVPSDVTVATATTATGHDDSFALVTAATQLSGPAAAAAVPPALLASCAVRPAVPAPFCGAPPAAVDLSRLTVYYLPTLPPVAERWGWPRWLLRRAQFLGLVSSDTEVRAAVDGGGRDGTDEPSECLSQAAEPAAQAAVLRAVAALRRAGVPAANVHALPLPPLSAGFDIWSACVSGAGGPAFRDLLLQDCVDPDAEAPVATAATPAAAVDAGAEAARAEKQSALRRLFAARLQLYLLSDAWLVTRALVWLVFQLQLLLRSCFTVHRIPDVFAARARAAALAGKDTANACAVPMTVPRAPTRSLPTRIAYEVVVTLYIFLHVVLCALAPSLTPHTVPALLLSLVEALSEAVPALRRRGQEKARAVAAVLHSALSSPPSVTGAGNAAAAPGPAVLVLPPHPVLAPRHTLPYFTPFNVVYTAIFNALQLPVTSVPMGLDVCRDGYYPTSRWYDYRSDSQTLTSRADALAAAAGRSPAVGASAAPTQGGCGPACRCACAMGPCGAADSAKVVASPAVMSSAAARYLAPATGPAAAVAAESCPGFVPTQRQRHPAGPAFAGRGLGSGAGVLARAAVSTFLRMLPRGTGGRRALATLAQPDGAPALPPTPSPPTGPPVASLRLAGPVAGAR